MKTAVLISAELRVLSRSRASLVWFFLMPLLFSLFFGIAFSESDQRPRVALGIVNEDEGFLSRRLTDELKSEGFTVNELSAGDFEADESMPRALFIPKRFTERVLDGETVKITLKKREDANVKASKAAEANIFKAIIRILGNLSLMELEETADSTATMEAAYDRAVPGEPRVELVVEIAGRYEKIPSGFNHTVPGNVVMFVLMCVLIYGIHLLIAERKSGLLLRISVGPVSTAQILSSRLLSRAMAGVIQVVVLFAAAKFLFGVYFGSSWAGLLLLMASYVMCVAGLSMLVGAIVDTPEYASGLSVLLTLVMSSLGGCWWPLEVVPSPVRELAFVFPTGWAMDGLHKVMAFGYGLRAVVPNALVLGGMFVLFTAASIRLMRKMMTQ
ncbi:MAG: ABC transporter permease [Candidatus Glassbacteria bacterium]